MVRHCLFLVLALAMAVMAGEQGPDSGHNHHHYYGQVTNNVHHHHGGHHRGGHHEESHEESQEKTPHEDQHKDDHDDNHHDDDHHDDDHHDDDHHDDDHHDDDHHDDDHHDDDHHDHHVYHFQIGDANLGAYAYLDDHGLLRGAYIDLMNAVCKRAGKRCHYILDDFQRCWKVKGDEEHPGVGLLLNAYDGCIGLAATPERLNSFNFTEPFSLNPKAGLFFRQGETPAAEVIQAANLTGHTLGFVNGWAMNAKCVRRQHGVFHGFDFEAKFYDTHKAMVQALHAGEVDAVVSINVLDANKYKLEHAGPWFKCTETGLAVMAHYGSEVINWWNDGLEKLREEHGWKALCDKANLSHGSHGKIYCVE